MSDDFSDLFGDVDTYIEPEPLKPPPGDGVIAEWPRTGKEYEVMFSVAPSLNSWYPTVSTLITGDACVFETMRDNGNNMEDGGFSPIPKEPGVYRAKAKYWFWKDYLGETDYGFTLSEVSRIDLEAA